MSKSDRWRMPSFLEFGLVRMTVSTWIFMDLSLTFRTLKTGVNWISSSGCSIKQIGSQNGRELVSIEDQDFTLMIALVLFKCSVKGTAPATVSQHPKWVGPQVWPILAVPCSWPINRSLQRYSYMEIWTPLMAQHLTCAWQNFRALIMLSLHAAIMAYP